MGLVSLAHLSLWLSLALGALLGQEAQSSQRCVSVGDSAFLGDTAEELWALGGKMTSLVSICETHRAPGHCQ